MSDNKQKIISDIYNDPSGFASKSVTLADARKKDKTITIDDVNEFFKNNVEQKKKPRGHNSFVAPHADYEYQLDLFFVGKADFEAKQKTRVGLLMIDVFSKYAVVVPIPSKSPEDVLAGALEALKKMDHKPKLIYADEEGSLVGERVDIRGYFKEQGIEHQQRTP